MEIYFDINCDIPFPGEYKTLIDKTIIESLKYENVKYETEISVSIVNSEEIKELNMQYRNINSVTDVLSFPQYTLSELENIKRNNLIALGDIVICYERAIQQAIEYGHCEEREICFLTAHSMLHLLGYDHLDDLSEKEMFAKQEAILANMGLSR